MLKLLAWYDYVLRLATHAKATYYLFFLSMAESSFFPIPPDVMLAPMCLAQPNRAWRLAFVTTIGSVLGGMIGYGIGAYAFGYIEPILLESGYMDSYLHAVSWFEEWGFWAIFVAGFSPIPYKVFTIGAGLLHMAFLPFLLASAVGRGARFFLVSALMKWGGVKMEQKLRQYVEALGWGLVILVVVAYFLLR